MIKLNNSLRMVFALVAALSALVAVWQFYLFVQFKDVAGKLDPQGGGLNLGLAILAALVACGMGAFVAFSVVTHEKEDVMHITS